MPGKSKRNKRKTAQNRKEKRGQIIQSMTQSQAMTHTEEHPTPTEPVRPVSSSPEPQAIAAQRSYVASELRRIGIITVIMLAALIILFMVLS
jgi:hypothetical protein